MGAAVSVAFTHADARAVIADVERRRAIALGKDGRDYEARYRKARHLAFLTNLEFAAIGILDDLPEAQDELRSLIEGTGCDSYWRPIERVQGNAAPRVVR